MISRPFENNDYSELLIICHNRDEKEKLGHSIFAEQSLDLILYIQSGLFYNILDYIRLYTCKI